MKRHESMRPVGAATAGPWLAAAVLMGAVTSAHAQADVGDNESKIARCRENWAEIIWLDRAALRARCGAWAYAHTRRTVRGEREQIVYSRYFVVNLDNGVVTSVRRRRHIFTGFKLDSKSDKR